MTSAPLLPVEEAAKAKKPLEHVIYVCAGTGCRASGAMALAEALEVDALKRYAQQATGEKFLLTPHLG